MIPSGIEPGTFRFLAQYLNHCATAVSCVSSTLLIIIKQNNDSNVTVHQYIHWTRNAYDRISGFVICAGNSLLVLSGKLVQNPEAIEALFLVACSTKFGSECAVTLNTALQYTTHRSDPPTRDLFRRLWSYSVTRRCTFFQ
jgi:hypothetical protein